MGKSLNLVPLYGSCVPDYYTPILITGESTIENKADIVKKFVAASSRGFQYAIQFPPESAAILQKYAPETDQTLVQTSQNYLSPRYQGDAPRWGEQSLEVWTAFGQWMDDNGLLSGPFDPTKAFTNEFLP
jgi:ABC-type nitrate/sulfonate/bicarbonate transport system substrate-binding protein